MIPTECDHGCRESDATNGLDGEAGEPCTIGLVDENRPRSEIRAGRQFETSAGAQRLADRHAHVERRRVPVGADVVGDPGAVHDSDHVLVADEPDHHPTCGEDLARLIGDHRGDAVPRDLATGDGSQLSDLESVGARPTFAVELGPQLVEFTPQMEVGVVIHLGSSAHSRNGAGRARHPGDGQLVRRCMMSPSESFRWARTNHWNSSSCAS